MGGPSNISSDILGIEVGRSAIRGVRLNQESAQLTAAAESVFGGDVVAPDGVIDPAVFGPMLDDLLMKLGVRDRSAVRVGFTVGPRNSGVGSGPAMASWLEAQAVNLGESMMCSGGLGIAFVPSRAVDAVVKLATGAGVELVRVDFAPVATARAIGDQVEDLICIGSGQGWQARMRDFEVLEAMENSDIGIDDPLAIFGPNGPPRSIECYGWVEVSPHLERSQRLNIGQLAPAVGVAIGVAFESPANLLAGKTIPSGLQEAIADPALRHLAGYELSGEGADATLRLQPRNDPSAPDRPEGRRTPRTAPTTKLSPLGGGAGGTDGTVPDGVGGSRRGGSRSGDGRSGGESHGGGGSRSRRGGGRSARAESGRGPTTRDPAWEASVDESDPIAMFSPDTEVDHMMGKRDRRLSIDILAGLLVVSAILLLLAYLFL